MRLDGELVLLVTTAYALVSRALRVAAVLRRLVLAAAVALLALLLTGRL